METSLAFPPRSWSSENKINIVNKEFKFSELELVGLVFLFLSIPYVNTLWRKEILNSGEPQNNFLLFIK